MNNNQNDFDNLLKAGLKKHITNVPAGFTQRLLTRVQREEYAAALTRLRRTEKLLVAAMILTPVIAGIFVLLFGPAISTQLKMAIGDIRQQLWPFIANNALHLKFQAAIAVGLGVIAFYFLFDSASAES